LSHQKSVMYFRAKETKNNQTCFFADPSADALLREQHIKMPAIKRASACRQSHKKWLDRQAFFVKM
ncbi:hypothetical protein P9B45_21885, partial [Bacillus paralicheniformis]|uniref:hypothetical protein n=1 Tax=Bacillus paralicheniformis TaxID=1648923 RepID=UPI002DBB06B0